VGYLAHQATQIGCRVGKFTALSINSHNISSGLKNEWGGGISMISGLKMIPHQEVC
jgi:hypothetical protein